jgi:hypothetical protein
MGGGVRSSSEGACEDWAFAATAMRHRRIVVARMGRLL